ncbi:histone-like nucleoid-structuring protein Lsr2 [Brevibacterium daeguense]|nr:Lsr2 family protein [Brevibacterium daeguense]
MRLVLTDDLDGSPGAETVSFALDGSAYEIELSEKNAAALREALAPYIAKARSANRPARTASRRSSGPKTDTAAVRAWAKDSGYEISERGRIPSAVLEAYEAAH